MKYDVISYDVWGNDEDGYEVNDAHKVGTIELAAYQCTNDARLTQCLINEGLLKEGTTAQDLIIEGWNEIIYIAEYSNSYPLYELRKQD